MTLLLALVAQCLHIALVLLAAPTLLGALDWAEARLAGRAAPSWRAPWQALGRLCRKQSVRAEGATPLLAGAPLLACAALAVGAALVPSFTLGMLFARFADLLVVGGLLALARVALALTALDDGTAAGGVAARQAMTLTLGMEPALLLVLLALGLSAGTTNVDLIAGLRQVRMVQPLAAVVLAAVAVALLAVVQRDSAMPEAEGLGGAPLVLARMAEALRLLLWLDLIGALFIPLGMASARAFPAGWIVGLLAWVLRLGVSVGLLAALRVGVGRLRWRQVPTVLGIALLFAALASLLVLARTRPV